MHLTNGDYKDVYEFAYDMRLIWRNCCTYNQEISDVYKVGKKLSELFEERFAKIEEQSSFPCVCLMCSSCRAAVSVASAA